MKNIPLVDYGLTPEQIARKESLDLPIHRTSKDCEFDWDSGYCRCGKRNPNWVERFHLSDLAKPTRGKVTLDIIDREYQ